MTKTYKIYLLEDINDLKYVGSTGEKYLNSRLATHRRDKKIGQSCSSSKLNLYYSSMTLLEEVSAEDRYKREKYWINEIDCVNTIKYKTLED
jgi:predicted GIY-YIG superfamily endonuclease